MSPVQSVTDVPVHSPQAAAQNKNDRTIVIQIMHTPGQDDPAYKINETPVAKADLPARLADIYANRAERVMFILGDDDVDFRYAAEVIDIGHAAGVDHIGLLTPKMLSGMMRPAPSRMPDQAQSEIINNQLIAPTRIPHDIMMVIGKERLPGSTGGIAADSGASSNGMKEVIGQSINKPKSKPEVLKKVKISAGVAVGMLLQKTQPEYPPIAKAARVSGTVVLDVTISKTGAVENLRVVSGPAMLQRAALEAVMSWRYRPYLLNNEPAEVETTVNVNFNLSK
jgi:protein TonB